ncbi:PREDICTED: retinoid-inducible serine carboxypeptidase-like [Papilio polytes]|uniref:retinoid-inducible serine carboxypeptidase-like n=1 Tax=Papilio polytes TaxID=76194 RepID=UPI0006766470|nr:PREDICTED: retinoid-inducible serine carboxypeptidase-like [Papilio polytes]
MKKCILVCISVLTILVGLAESENSYETIRLKGKGFSNVAHTVAFTKISGVGELFWLFWPSLAEYSPNQPLIVWLDGVTGVPPSLRANFEMFGPFGTNLRRQESWIQYFNLLLIDAPVGTGYSKAEDENNISTNFEDHVDNLVTILKSFYGIHEEYSNTPVYIFGQGHGAQLAVALAARLAQNNLFNNVVKGVGIGNGIISPAQALTKIGFYLEEFGKIDADGRKVVENFSDEINTLTNNGRYEEAFDLFLSIKKVVNINAGAGGLNLDDISEKLTRDKLQEYFNRRLTADHYKLMEETVPPLIGLSGKVIYDGQRDAVLKAFRNSLMKPAVDKVEYLLQNTNISVTIYNGNLDAISNTPGQLLWVDNLRWSGQKDFLNYVRKPFVRSRGLQGYYRKTSQLHFYWMNSVGQSVPLDGYYGMTRILQIITNTV